MIMNMETNKQFKRILETSEKKVQISLLNIKKLLFPNFISVYDCIIINDTPISISKEKFNDIINKMYTDKTGYEASNTETLINFIIGEEEFAISEMIQLALIAIDVWALSLKMMDKESKFCFIISCDIESSFVTLRYHKVRNNEDMWLVKDLEEYNQPIAYAII